MAKECIIGSHQISQWIPASHIRERRWGDRGCTLHPMIILATEGYTTHDFTLSPDIILILMTDHANLSYSMQEEELPAARFADTAINQQRVTSMN
jgi:hypothetical protein